MQLTTVLYLFLAADQEAGSHTEQQAQASSGIIISEKQHVK
jgi:hypothetical protein